MTREHIAGEIAASGYRLPVYAYQRPSDLDGKATRRVPVVIVGAGLSGLACALDLTTRGVPCLVLDDDCTVGVRGASSRGIAYARKTLEILGRLGALAPVAARGVTWTVGRTFDYDHELIRFNLAMDGSSLQPPFVNIQQFYVEAAMVDRAYEMEIDIRWKNTVTGIHAERDHVRLDIATPDGTYDLDAEWVIDASGVNSRLREPAGISVQSSSGEDRWCICDVRFKRPWPVERWTWLRAHFNGGRAVWRHPMPDDVWRLDYQLSAGEGATLIDDNAAYQMVRNQVGPKEEFEVVWAGPWAYRNQLAERFRSGRVFLVGDAAHAFSPFGGRGGNSGIQDSENLAWKLALVLRGVAPEALLDSYNEERREAARHNIQVTSETNEFLNPTSRIRRLLRNGILESARKLPFMRSYVNSGKMSVPFVYKPSPVILEGGHALSDIAIRYGDDRKTRTTELLAGPIAGVLLDFCEDPEASAKLRAAVAASGREIRFLRVSAEPGADDLLVDGVLRRNAGLPAEGEAVVLLRPDGHVAAMGARELAPLYVQRSIGLPAGDASRSEMI